MSDIREFRRDTLAHRTAHLRLRQRLQSDEDRELHEALARVRAAKLAQEEEEAYRALQRVLIVPFIALAVLAVLLLWLGPSRSLLLWLGQWGW